ncbi:hypothetical protein QVD17_05888 [Tagetes erecta]|uniref:Uncharacterized protein n=1 Tax=Tagetes erecta TaxID=13708 RepID=A0AAD8LID8_TARER|nr:hypothetical protein QVD17_05888 [Tagetes erecta]
MERNSDLMEINSDLTYLNHTEGARHEVVLCSANASFWRRSSLMRMRTKSRSMDPPETDMCSLGEGFLCFHFIVMIWGVYYQISNPQSLPSIFDNP